MVPARPPSGPASRAQLDLHRVTSAFGPVAALSGAWIEPDPHEPARRRIDERLLRALEAGLHGPILAAARASRCRDPLGLLRSIAASLESDRDDARAADDEQPDAAARGRASNGDQDDPG